MRNGDTDVRKETELKDGKTIYSCKNRAGVPYVFCEDENGMELGSLEVRADRTIADCVNILIRQYATRPSVAMA